MSPEYAMEGRFSEKSDVFSFGVLLLEIISGRKNTSFYHDENVLSLLGLVRILTRHFFLINLVNFTFNSLQHPNFIHIELIFYMFLGMEIMERRESNCFR